MDVHGYMVKISWDGSTLTAQGTNTASRIALAGPNHSDGPLVLPADNIERVTLKTASLLTNGRLDVHTTDGHRYQLHYRRRHARAFTNLANALGVPVNRVTSRPLIP